MALQIPRSSLPGVAHRTAPDVRPPSAPDFGGGEAAQRAYGQARGLANDVSGIVVQEEMRAQEAQFNELSILADKAEFDRKAALSKVQGKAALEASRSALADFDKDVEGIGGQATSRAIREKLALRMERNRMGLQSFAEGHSRREMDRYSSEVFQGSRQSIVNAGAQNPDDQLRISLAEDELISLHKRNGALTGKASELVNAEMAEDRSALHSGVIMKFNASGQDLKAKAYFEANKDSMILSDQIRFGKQVQESSTLGEGIRIAVSLAASYPTLKEQNEALKKMFADKQVSAEVYKHVQSNLDHEDTLRRKAEHEERVGNFAAAITNIDDAFRKGIRPGGDVTTAVLAGRSYWDVLGGDERLKLDGLVDDLMKPERAMRKDLLLAQAHSMTQEQLAAISEQEMISRFFIGLSKEDYNHVKGLWEKARSDVQGFKSDKMRDEIMLDGLRGSGLGGWKNLDTLATVSDTDKNGKYKDSGAERKLLAWKSFKTRIDTRREAEFKPGDKVDDKRLREIVAEEAFLSKRKINVERLEGWSHEGNFGGVFTVVEGIEFADLKVGDKIPMGDIPLFPKKNGMASRTSLMELLSRRALDGNLDHAKYVTADRVQRLYTANLLRDDNAVQAILEEKP